MNKIIFSGLLILVCCLFVDVGAIEAKSAYDISGKCISLPKPVPRFTIITPDDVCQAAGLGSCLRVEVGEKFEAFNEEDCIGASSPITINNGCSTTPTFNVIAKSIIATDLVCKPRTWGMVPQPANVPGDFKETIMNATNWILGFASIITTLVILWGGVNYLTAAGDEDKAMTGKKTIKYGVMGLVIMGIAYAVVIAVLTVLK